MELEAVIGLEVHVQLKTKSKMFCRCDNRDDQPPNSAICPVCSGQPGALPVPNAQAIDWAVKTSLALGCAINQESKFDRKNYFYPDLPKGYQISQYDKPFGHDGTLTFPVAGVPTTIRINRLHLEEDAGKLMHSGSATLVDLNRSGTPLCEIVSEPDFRTPAQAKAYLEEMQLIMRYLGVSDADMEKGHLRCDANISLRPVGEEKLYPKTEIKNLNSFRSVERALQYEIDRQTKLWNAGTPVMQQSTRGWDDGGQKTTDQRAKEDAADYRYFPEPDLPPVMISDDHLARLLAEVPELPAARRERFMDMYRLTTTQADGLVAEKTLANYFEEVVSEFRDYAETEIGADKASALWEAEKGKETAVIANWLLNRISGERRAAEGLPVPAVDLGRLLWMVHQNVINIPSAVQVYDHMIATKKGPHQLVKDLGLEQVSDTGELEKILQEIIAANENVVAEVKSGKAPAAQFLVGQAMKATKGKANPQMIQELLKKLLGT